MSQFCSLGLRYYLIETRGNFKCISNIRSIFHKNKKGTFFRVIFSIIYHSIEANTLVIEICIDKILSLVVLRNNPDCSGLSLKPQLVDLISILCPKT